MATTFKQVVNNGQVELASAIDNSTLTIPLATGDGAKLPASGAFWFTIDDEIILIASRSTDTLTATTRGVQGTVATSHDAGAIGELRWTKSNADDIHTAINAVENILGGVNAIPDDTYVKFGTDGDFKLGYDETTDDRLELLDAANNVMAYWKDLGTTGMFGVTGRIETPQIGVTADVDLLVLAANLLTVNGDITATGTAPTFGANANGATYLAVIAAAGTSRGLRLQTAGSRRWEIVAGSTAESGSNTGTPLWIHAYDDSNVFIDTVLSITRAAGGAITIARPLVGATSQAVFNTGSTTITAFGAATSITCGANSDSAFSLFHNIGMQRLSGSACRIYTTVYNTLRIDSAYGAAANATLDLDFSSAQPTSKEIRCFRVAPSPSGIAEFNIYVPNTSTKAVGIDAKTGDTTIAGTLTVNGNVTLGNASTDQLTIRGNPILSDSSTPTSGGAGTAGMYTWDANYLYVCTATNTWKRVALTGGY